MFKRTLISLFMIGMMVILIYGMTGSGAWFSSSTSASGSISSGNFDLKISGGPLDMTKLEPGAGYRPVGEFCVQNKGDYDMKFHGMLKDVSDPGGLLPYLLLKLEIKAINETDQNTYGPMDGAVLASDISFNDLMDWNQAILLAPDAAGTTGPFEPEMKACYKLSAKLSSEADNDQLSKTLAFDLFIQSTQWINAGW